MKVDGYEGVDDFLQVRHTHEWSWLQTVQSWLKLDLPDFFVHLNFSLIWFPDLSSWLHRETGVVTPAFKMTEFHSKNKSFAFNGIDARASCLTELIFERMESQGIQNGRLMPLACSVLHLLRTVCAVVCCIIFLYNVFTSNVKTHKYTIILTKIRSYFFPKIHPNKLNV